MKKGNRFGAFAAIFFFFFLINHVTYNSFLSLRMKTNLVVACRSPNAAVCASFARLRSAPLNASRPLCCASLSLVLLPLFAERAELRPWTRAKPGLLSNQPEQILSDVSFLHLIPGTKALCPPRAPTSPRPLSLTSPLTPPPSVQSNLNLIARHSAALEAASGVRTHRPRFSTSRFFFFNFFLRAQPAAAPLMALTRGAPPLPPLLAGSPDRRIHRSGRS